ncbi:GspE/PulE family protein [Massilia sp. R2A-15]|uniref:GspE/PulE family protein n=1 Tax=Massilia sp. R2A-15 TaxID=3064278 RepID=UPI00273416E3|nr:GspE/PulE family protein [Massilia sp. R2A-15]WLI91037.1 GspE/PulE family protein [Massilia sp. R2A-15]
MNTSAESDQPPHCATRISQYLQWEFITTREQLEAVLRDREEMVKLKLGEALLEQGLISKSHLALALDRQLADQKAPLGNILVQMGIVDSFVVRRALFRRLGIPYVNVLKFQLEPVLVNAMHEEFMRKHGILPLFRTDTRMVVAVENPLATEPLQELAFYTKLKIDAVMAGADELAEVMEHCGIGFGAPKKISELATRRSGADADMMVLPEIDSTGEADGAVVRLVDMIVMEAIEYGASDIHIETMRGDRPVCVRFRKDGVMFHYSDVPARFKDGLISRIKIMSQLDISEKRHSQDGKVSFDRVGLARVDLRVATVPTSGGAEDIVMRILTPPTAVSLDALGLAPDVLAHLRELAGKPQGLLFVCGPTGSGKTTTVHALLARLNTPSNKIWTVEDPIEIVQEGLRQVQVQAKIGWSFAAVLRCLMRADPDIIMVGETRDSETARTVIEASLTGHLVLSTMHTNSAAESMVRLLDFGLDPFNFADALIAVLAQRLVRRLCSECSQAIVASDEQIRVLAQAYCFETELEPAAVQAQWRARHGDADGRIHLKRAPGCTRCDNSGYKGRVGVHELLIATAAIKQMIHAKVTAAELLRAAIGQGMRTLRQDGIEKILQGVTTWEQIRAI